MSVAWKLRAFQTKQLGGRNADVYYVRLVFSDCHQRVVSDPTDRTTAIRGLVEKAGGELIAAYMSTGSKDIVVIADAPDGSDAVAAGMAAAATGAFTKIETVRAWTLPEFKAIAEKAGRVGAGFKPPGT